MLLQTAKNSFFFMVKQYPFLCVCVCVCVCVPHLLYPFICSMMDTSCFPILTIVNNSAMNIEVHVSFQINVFRGFFGGIYLGMDFCVI